MEDVCLKVWLIAQNLGKNITDFEPSAIISIEGQLSPPSMVQSYWTSQNEVADTQKYHFCNFCTLILIHLNVVFIPKLQELCPKSLAPHGGAARKRRGGSCTAQRRGEAGDDGGWISWKKGWDTLQGNDHISPQKLAFWVDDFPNFPRWEMYPKASKSLEEMQLEAEIASLQRQVDASSVAWYEQLCVASANDYVDSYVMLIISWDMTDMNL